MPKTRLLTEFGQGSSLRHRDYTSAARKALQDALWHNSINLAELFGKDKEAMIIDVEVGVQEPDALDCESLKDIFPYGQISITGVKGGLDVPRLKGHPTVIATVAINVSLDLEDVA
jgi:uncharacterized protein (TIGR02058 family)